MVPFNKNIVMGAGLGVILLGGAIGTNVLSINTEKPVASESIPQPTIEIPTPTVEPTTEPTIELKKLPTPTFIYIPPPTATTEPTKEPPKPQNTVCEASKGNCPASAPNVTVCGHGQDCAKSDSQITVQKVNN